MNEHPPLVFAYLCVEYGAKMNVEQVQVVLRFCKNDVKRLVAAKMLPTLGKPKHNSVKWFATITIAKLAQDSDWLSKAVKLCQTYNNKRTENCV